VRYLRLLRLFAQIELQFALEYRANLVLDLLEEVIVVVSSLVAVLVLFSGWLSDVLYAALDPRIRI